MPKKVIATRGELLPAPFSAVPSPTSYLSLAPDTIALWGSTLVRIVAIRDLGRVQVVILDTNEPLDVRADTLRAPPGRALSVSFDRVDATPDQWSQARTLAADFEVDIERRALAKAVMHALADKHGLSVRTIQRKRAVYKVHRRAVALLIDVGGRRVGTTLLDPRTERVIQFVIDRRYARREYTSGLEIAERARSICRRLGWPVPASRTVARRIAAAAGQAMDEARLGKKDAAQRWKPVPGKLFVERPLEVCQIDHTLVDLMVLNPDRSQVLGRPWLTVAIDVATRCILGIYLTMDAPSAVSVAMCLEHAILPKSTENRDRSGRWPMYGKPLMVLTDNGKDFRSEAMENGCAEHGIRLDFRPPGTPRFGGHIERMMGTLMRMVHGLSGTTFSNVHARRKYPSEAHAMMTLAELREWLVVRICQYYHVKRHRSLNVAPLVAWDRAWTQPSGELLLPSLIADPQQFRLDFMPCDWRQITRTGITFKNSRYWHSDMAAFVGHDEAVLIRFHPQDLSRIWFRGPDGGMVEAPAVAGPGAGQGHASHNATESAKLDAILDQGFDESDQIEAVAREKTKRRPRTTRESQPLPGRGGREHVPSAKSKEKADRYLSEHVTPNRASIRTEELF